MEEVTAIDAIGVGWQFTTRYNRAVAGFLGLMQCFDGNAFTPDRACIPGQGLEGYEIYCLRLVVGFAGQHTDAVSFDSLPHDTIVR